jgi:hypothetical protein
MAAARRASYVMQYVCALATDSPAEPNLMWSCGLSHTHTQSIPGFFVTYSPPTDFWKGSSCCKNTEQQGDRTSFGACLFALPACIWCGSKAYRRRPAIALGKSRRVRAQGGRVSSCNYHYRRALHLLPALPSRAQHSTHLSSLISTAATLAS